MKRRSFRVGIIGGILISAVLGLLLVQFSSAQTASSSLSSTSTSPPESTTSTLSAPLQVSPSPSSSADSAPTSTASDQTVSSTPTNLAQSSPSSTPDASATMAASPDQLPSSVSESSSPSSPGLFHAPTSTASGTTPLSAPTGLTASAISASQIDLAWNGSMVGVTGYIIYRGGSLIATIAATSSASAKYSDTGLAPGTAYAYTVAADDAAGNASAKSAQASATTQAAPPPPPAAYATCDQTVKTVPGDYPSIQAAMNAASSGDTIKIAAGIYHENVGLKSGICLEGAGMDQTVLSKSGVSGITGDGVAYVIIKNLTVKNSGGSDRDGGGITLSASDNITLQSCHLTGNISTNGGGMFVSGSSVIVDHCLIDNNTAGNIGAGMVVESNSIVGLTNSTVVNNNWSNALGNGGVGGVSSHGSRVQITNSILWGNTSQDLSGSNVSVSNSDIGAWSGGTNNVNSDPKFVSAIDYHLQTSSPAAGMGSY